MKRDDKTVAKLCELIETTGLTIADVCKKVGIGRSSYYRWKQDETYGASIKKALEVRNDNLADIAEDSLMKKITGYTVKETKKVKRLVDGRMKITETTETNKFIEPDTTALIFLLTNLRPDKWKRNVVDKDVVDDFKEFIVKTSIAQRNDGTDTTKEG